MEQVSKLIHNLGTLEDCESLAEGDARIINNVVRYCKVLHETVHAIIKGEMTHVRAVGVVENADEMEVEEPDRYLSALHSLNAAADIDLQEEDESDDVEAAVAEVDAAIDALCEALSELGYDTP